MSGRTGYVPMDMAWWRRSRIVELGQEHGPAGPAVVHWLTCEARAQGPVRGHDGRLRSGYAAIAHGCFLSGPDQARAIVATAADVGLLDDLEEAERTFTCRISGWHEDVNLPLEAARKASARQPADSGTTGDNRGHAVPMSQDVPERPLEEKERKNRGGEGNAPEGKRVPSGAGGTHPDLQTVLDVLEAAPNVFVDAMAVDSACRSRPDADVVAAAHTVASWAHEGGLRQAAGNRLLMAALDKQHQARRDGQRTAIRHPPRRGAPTTTDKMDDLAKMHADAVAAERPR